MKKHKTSKAWMREHVTDPYVQRARMEGWRSRAAFKLMEIDDKDHLLRPGLLVVDLGAAPGSWSQVAVARVGRRGRVLALDLLEMAPLAGVEFTLGDFREDAVLAALTLRLDGQPVDLVISDMAPNMSGIAVTDQARSVHLSELALEFAGRHLKPGGNFLVKIFQGAGFDAFRKAMAAAFDKVVVRKPKSSRDRSSEVYLLGLGCRPHSREG
ncbi:MAG: RlmE family RNA methyltransferase [Rhodocyclales bacterium]|nr:RlmE family RNA methyltransferase [Rhodocyclales bacterium]